jgi:steroid delta-isomerase-like uncharacterized protein
MREPTDLTDRIERLYDGVWNRANPAIAEELVDPDFHFHDRELSEDLSGPELYFELASSTREIFPDMTIAIEDSFAVDDRVAVRWTMTGTHDGELLGVDPTGREVTIPAIEINRFENGLLKEAWSQSDMLGALGQIRDSP